eukprot:10644515-Lingulodinium_polyedra.AAC.1
MVQGVTSPPSLAKAMSYEGAQAPCNAKVSLSDSDVEMAVPAKAEQGPDQFDAAFVGDEGPHDARGA